MNRPALLIDRLRRGLDWRVWLAVHVAALALQWATVSAAPIVMQKANAKGWWALCITAKGP